MSTSPDPPARRPRAALPAGDGPAEADNLPALRSPGQMQRPADLPAPDRGGHSAMPGQHGSGHSPSGHDGASSWFSPGPHGPGSPVPGASGPGPQGYGQSAWQGSGYSHQGYGNSGPAAGGYNQGGYQQGGYGQSSYAAGYNQGGYNSGPGYGAQGAGASGPGYGSSGPGYGVSGPGHASSGPGYGPSGPGYPAPGAHSARPGDFQSAPPPVSPPAGFAAEQAAPPAPPPPPAPPAAPPAPEVPETPSMPTRAEQRPAFAPPGGAPGGPADQSPFGPVPNGQEPAGGPRHAAPPPPPDEPQLYDAAAHEEALYRRMRGNGHNSGSHRQPEPAPAFTGAPTAGAGTGGTFSDPAYGGPGPVRNDAPQPPQTFGAEQYGTAPSFDGPGFDGPGFGGPGFGGPPPAAGARPRPGSHWKPPAAQRGRTKAIARSVGLSVLVIAVGVGIGYAVAPHVKGGSTADPGCKAYTATALPAYDHAVDDLNAKARQPTLASDLTATINDLSTAQGSAQSAKVKTALGGLHDELASVRTDVQKGYIPSSAVTALNNASHAADNAC